MTDAPLLRKERRNAFTLLELLMVIGILSVLYALAGSGFAALAASRSSPAQAAFEMASILENARAYAIAQSTYVFVGLTETDAARSPGAVPQNAGVGRVAVSVVASRDGTKHYATSTRNQGSDWIAHYADPSQPEYKGGHLIQIGNLRRFENLHLSDQLNGYSHAPPASGGMARPRILSNYYVLGTTTSTNQVLRFTYPLGFLAQAGSGCQYLFDRVIQFDPSGTAQIVCKTNGSEIGCWMEIGLQAANGTAVSGTANVAAIQISGLTGGTRVYTP